MFSKHQRSGLRVAALVAAAVIASMIGLSRSPQAQPVQPPNIVVIMADDLDVQSLQAAIDNGPLGNGDTFMPNLKRFILTGASSFTNSFVTESLCCPSRSTFLTGLYPHNHGVLRNTGENGGFAAFDKAFKGSTPLPAWLQTIGYRTAHVGKYLNGYLDYKVVPGGWTEWQALVDNSTYCMYDYKISQNGKLLDFNDNAHPGQPDSEYQTDVLAGLAEEIVRSTDTRPLFLSVAPLATHVETLCADGSIRPAPRHIDTVSLPLPQLPQVASFNEADMTDKPAWMQPLPLQNVAALQTLYNDRIAALRSIDDLIGKVGAALDETAGRLNQTVFIFTSDNGYLLGQHRWAGKVLLYEESIRVPLIIKVPGIAGPQTISQFALNNDLAPTIAELAGVTPAPAVDGQSLLPLLKGQQPTWRKRFLVELPPAIGAGSSLQPFFAVRREGPFGQPGGLVYGETLSVDGTSVTDVEFYDLAVDRYQENSLHGDNSQRRMRQRQQLKRALDALKTCANGACQQIEKLEVQ